MPYRHLIAMTALLCAVAAFAVAAPAQTETNASEPPPAAATEATEEQAPEETRAGDASSAPDATQPVSTTPPPRRRTRSFQPSEEITVDNSVPYPVDI